MEKIGTVLAVVGTIIFIVSIWMLFGYLYFKKGSIKKGLLLFVAGGVVIGVQGAWNNAEKGISLSQEVIDIVETTSAEQATKEQQSKVGSSVFLKINEDDWKKYEDKIKDYYVAWQKSLNPQADDETIRTEFKNLREQALLK